MAYSFEKEECNDRERGLWIPFRSFATIIMDKETTLKDQKAIFSYTRIDEKKPLFKNTSTSLGMSKMTLVTFKTEYPNRVLDNGQMARQPQLQQSLSIRLL